MWQQLFTRCSTTFYSRLLTAWRKLCIRSKASWPGWRHHHVWLIFSPCLFRKECICSACFWSWSGHDWRLTKVQGTPAHSTREGECPSILLWNLLEVSETNRLRKVEKVSGPPLELFWALQLTFHIKIPNLKELVPTLILTLTITIMLYFRNNCWF